MKRKKKDLKIPKIGYILAALAVIFISVGSAIDRDSLKTVAYAEGLNAGAAQNETLVQRLDEGEVHLRDLNHRLDELKKAPAVFLHTPPPAQASLQDQLIRDCHGQVVIKPEYSFACHSAVR
jgi:ribosomal protein L12E/L44/L45/RPP1/RPP2